MILRLALFTLAGVVAVADGAGFIAVHPWSDHRDRMRGGDSRSGGGGTFFREGGINGAAETAERRRRTGALCPLPAQMASAADADWCVCAKGSVCEGSGCDVDKWNPQEVKWFYSFFLLLFFPFFYKKKSFPFPLDAYGIVPDSTGRYDSAALITWPTTIWQFPFTRAWL